MTPGKQTSSHAASAMIPNAKSNGRSGGLQRNLDRYLGPVILLILSLFRRPRELVTESIESIGILKSTAIGDTVILSGSLASLRLRFPRARITVFAGPSNAAAARMLNPDEIVLIEPTRPLQAIREIRKHPVDVWIDFGSWSKLEAVYSFFAKSKYTIGFRSDRQRRHFAYDQSVMHSREVHENQNYHALLQPFGILQVVRPKLNLEIAQHGSLKHPYVVFHLWPGGSQAKSKEWPLERWRELGEFFETRGWTVVLTGGPAQAQSNDGFLRGLKSGINQAGLDLQESALLLSQADLVISVDTGVMHLASALEAPIIALHGPTHSQRWGPLGQKSVAINAMSATEAPIHFGWEIVSGDPMKKITVKDVILAAQTLVNLA